jgi:hypothetical protein
MTTTLAAPHPDASADIDWEPFYDLFDPEFDDPPPPPSWVLEACAERDRAQLAHAATQPVDLESLTALAGADPSTLDADALLDAIATAQRLINHTQALQQQFLAALARPGVAVPLANLVDSALHPTELRGESALGIAGDLPKNLPVTETGGTDYTPLLHQPEWRRVLNDQAARFASGEVSCLLGFAPVTARLRIENALVMVDELPATLAAQQRGGLDGYRASIIAERTAVLSPELRCDVERRVLPFATKRTSGALRRIVDREVIAADSTAAERRARYAKARRGVTVNAAEDGMATLKLFASAANTALVHGVLDSIATSIRTAGLADGRGASQLRADAMVDLFRTLNHTGHACIGIPSGADDTGDAGDLPPVSGVLPVTAAAAPQAAGTVRHGVTLNVYIDAATLAAENDHPGELAGFGAITADTARALARSADSIRAIVTRPAGPDRACGSVLDAGRTVYRPPTAVADYVTVRDRTCQFPGCRAPASRCDLDHRQAFDDDGDTCPHNLDLLCRAHHRLKTFTRWRAEPAASGLLTWTSPLGRSYATEPGHLARDGHTGNGSRRNSADDPPPF